MICSVLVAAYAPLESLMLYNVDDPLRVFCERMALPNVLNVDGHSKRARFYRWTKKIKKQWNIKEEKLIITLIIVILMFILSVSFEYGFANVRASQSNANDLMLSKLISIGNLCSSINSSKLIRFQYMSFDLSAAHKFLII
ncbi:unnamed protein product [Didymodactylos carnosus]|uniref:Uncharacterized protein n=1 Tax=Didymodactylos carnosus TaxID=1234261 RepID=A0A8S2E5Q2_9BILA|nr:unnamed protein product [Didymodactylos carnosus]CAF3832776.1 unnamed protein product [Didymodactylos carnosus]